VEGKRLVRNKNKSTKKNNNNSISDNKIKSKAEIFTNQEQSEFLPGL